MDVAATTQETVRARFWLITGMIVGAALLRLLPHPWNFTPIGAMALFGGARFDRKRWAFSVPLAAMALSDLALSRLHGTGSYPGIFVVYASFFLIVCLGLTLRGSRSAVRIGSAAIASATLFYLTTNFGVWAFSGMYPKTIAGLVGCYIAAIPFFGGTMAGDLFYSAALFGGLALAQRRFPGLAPLSAA